MGIIVFPGLGEYLSERVSIEENRRGGEYVSVDRDDKVESMHGDLYLNIQPPERDKYVGKVSFEVSGLEVFCLRVEQGVSWDEFCDIVMEFADKIESMSRETSELSEIGDYVDAEVVSVESEFVKNNYSEFPELKTRDFPFFVRVTMKKDDNVRRERFAPDIALTLSYVSSPEEIKDLSDGWVVVPYDFEDETDAVELEDKDDVHGFINTQIIRFEDDLSSL